MTAQPIDAPRGLVPRSEYYKALERIDELEAQIVELKEKLGTCDTTRSAIQSATKCTPREAEVAAYMLAHSMCMKAAIFHCLFQGDDDLPDIKVVDVFICKLRGSIRKAGGPATAIDTIWGQGYRLTPEGRAWLQGIASSPDPLKAASGHPSAITGQLGGDR